MSKRSQWMLILVVLVGVVVAGYAGRETLYRWLLALHGRSPHH